MAVGAEERQVAGDAAGEMRELLLVGTASIARSSYFLLTFFGGKAASGNLPLSPGMWSKREQSNLIEGSVLLHSSPRSQRTHAFEGCVPANDTERYEFRPEAAID